MRVSELNNYVKHYLEKDKTYSAIMLTSEWGSGKSYYIENELIPFLNKDNQYKCILISLYGIEDLSEISKSIYMESKTINLLKDNEAFSTSKLLAKTVIRGIAGSFGIDFELSNDDLKKLYESINLTGKLIVFEDVERSSLDIIKILGYINNLVERDGAKVLLVVNENEILNKSSEPDLTSIFQTTLENKKESKEASIPENVKRYSEIKEKTISDTIYFEGDYFQAVQSIIETFKNPKLEFVINKIGIKEIISMIKDYGNNNLRTFIFATQKTVDIFERMQSDYETDFLKCIYFGIILFSVKLKSGDFPEWEGTEYLSTFLGTNSYPLFKFCYDYLRWQRFDATKITESEKLYNEMKLYDQNMNQIDDDLNKLYSFYERTEAEVRNVLKTIEKRLENPEDIGFYNYGKLAAYLVVIADVIGYDYAYCRENMIENIRGKGKDIDSDILFLKMYDFNQNQEKEFNDFIGQMSKAMNTINTQKEFSYNPDNIGELYDYVINEKHKIKSNHEFISGYNADKIVEMLFCSSAKQIQDFRKILSMLYQSAGSNDFVEKDRGTLRKIQLLVQEKLKQPGLELDKIQLKQFEWVCENLQQYILQMT